MGGSLARTVVDHWSWHSQIIEPDFTLTGKKVVAAALASGKAVWLPEDHHRGQWERIYLEGAGYLGLFARGEAGCYPTWTTYGRCGD